MAPPESAEFLVKIEDLIVLTDIDMMATAPPRSVAELLLKLQPLKSTDDGTWGFGYDLE
jgi:hypothetical protein